MVHGDQWRAVAESVEFVREMVPRLLERGRLVAEADVEIRGEDGVARAESGFALAYPDTPLRYLALCATNSAGSEIFREFINGSPFCAEGVEAELEIEEVLPDEDPMEGGLVLATRDGGLMWLVDPLFFANRALYQPGRMLLFSVSALAYTVRPARTEPIVITSGNFLEFHRQRMLEEDPALDPDEIREVELSLEGARSFFPNNVDPLLGSTFRSPVEAVEAFEVEGTRFVRMRISPLTDEEQTVSMWLYAAPHVLGDYAPQVGDEVEGTAWIQGTPLRDGLA